MNQAAALFPLLGGRRRMARTFMKIAKKNAKVVLILIAAAWVKRKLNLNLNLKLSTKLLLKLALALTTTLLGRAMWNAYQRKARKRARGTRTRVVTPHGPCVGTVDMGIVSFRGIPFAKAERFAPPEMVQPWKSDLDCACFRSSAYSLTEDGVGFVRYSGLLWISEFLCAAIERWLGTSDVAEDCLYLNIYKDDTIVKQEGREVIVYTHGGAFVTGSSSETMYTLSNPHLPLLGKGAILVTLNYRLGAFGFLHDKERGIMNNGVKDIIAALKFVRQNIASFGGDADNITLMGQSAGGSLVALLMEEPSADHLFHKAIIMSTPNFTLSERAAERVRNLFYKLIGGYQRLRTCSAEWALLASAVVFLCANGTLPWAPLKPAAAQRQSRIIGKPLLIGTTRREMDLFLNFPLAAVPTRRPAAVRAIARQLLLSRISPSFMDIDAEANHIYDRHNGSFSDSMTEVVFKRPAREMAEAAPYTTFVYELDYASSVHCIDLPLVFGTYASFAGWYPQDPQELSERMQSEFAQFASTGRTTWQPFGSNGYVQVF